MKIDMTAHSGLSLAISLALGGLGVFLIAVKLMSNSLKSMSGGYTVKLMKKFSANRFLALGAGVVFTTMIQSSDGAVALAIGLIAAGFMDLRAAIPFILGANIGTATTAFIVYLGDVSFTQYFMILGFVGAMGYLMIKEERKSNIAMLVFAIGAIFIGLKVMGVGMKGISGTDGFRSVIKGVSSNSWGAMFTSTILTGLMQSSSATTTVIQSVYAGGSMTIQPAIAMIIGANIGTTFTALITSIGAGKEPKRIAVIWLFTNAVIALLVMPLIYYYSELITAIVPQHGVKGSTPLGSSHKLQLAVAHIIFNGTLAFVFIWAVGPLAKMSEWVIKDKNEKFGYEVNLPAGLINQSPELAFEAAKVASHELANMSKDSLDLLYEYMKNKDKETYKKFKSLENIIEATRKSIYGYLIEIGSTDISKRLSNKHMMLVLGVRSLERVPVIGHQFSTSINKMLVKDKISKEFKFNIPEEDYKNLKAILRINISLVKRASLQLKKNSKKRHEEMQELYIKLDGVCSSASKEHVRNNMSEDENYDYLGLVKLLLRMGHHSIRVSSYIRKGNKELESKVLSAKLEKELANSI